MIRGISSVVIELYVWEGELLRYLYKGDGVAERGVSIAVWLTLF